MSQFNTALWGGTVPQGIVVVTGRQLIIDAFRNLTVLRPGQTPGTDATDDGFRMLNRMVDSWATERLLVRVIARTVIDMSGAAQYLVTPHRIEAAGYIPEAAGSSESPLEVIRSHHRWSEIADKSQTGTPTDLYVEYNATNASEATLNPWPIPSDGQIAYYQWSVVLSSFEDLETEYALPAGWALALEWNLTQKLAPKFATLMAKGSDVLLEQIREEARESKAAIKRLNVQPAVLGCDPAVLNCGSLLDVKTGRY